MPVPISIDAIPLAESFIEIRSETWVRIPYSLCLAWYYANAESEVVAMLAPLVGQPSHASANLDRHFDCSHRWVRAGQRIIK